MPKLEDVHIRKDAVSSVLYSGTYTMLVGNSKLSTALSTILVWSVFGFDLFVLMIDLTLCVKGKLILMV